jgi:hypothetical protein
MNNNGVGRGDRAYLVWPAVFLGAAVATGLWLWLAQGERVQVLLACAALAAALTVVGLLRARAARRLHAALDAYADREIVQARLKHTPGRERVRQSSRVAPIRRPHFVRQQSKT